jgi:hypothetical protein
MALKRKTEKESKNSGNDLKHFKVQIIETKKKPLTKALTKSELVLQVQHLHQTIDALEDSNRKKIEIIEGFEGKMNNLERQIDVLSCRETVSSKESQTEADLQSKCDECDKKSEQMNSEYQGVRHCEQCGYAAEDKNDLDAHERFEHTNFVDEGHVIVIFVENVSQTNLT